MGVNHDIWPTPCSRPFGQQLSHVLWIRLLACEVRMPSDQVGFASMAGKWSRDPTVFESIEQGAAYPFLVPVAPPAGRAPLVPVEINKRRPPWSTRTSWTTPAGYARRTARPG